MIKIKYNYLLVFILVCILGSCKPELSNNCESILKHALSHCIDNKCGIFYTIGIDTLNRDIKFNLKKSILYTNEMRSINQSAIKFIEEKYGRFFKDQTIKCDIVEDHFLENNVIKFEHISQDTLLSLNDRGLNSKGRYGVFSVFKPSVFGIEDSKKEVLITGFGMQNTTQYVLIEIKNGGFGKTILIDYSPKF